jgi:hypothetical protein
MIVSCLAANGAVICSPKKSSTDCKAHLRHCENALYKNSHYYYYYYYDILLFLVIEVYSYSFNIKVFCITVKNHAICYEHSLLDCDGGSLVQDVSSGILFRRAVTS